MIARILVTLVDWVNDLTGAPMLGYVYGTTGSCSVIEGTLQVVSMSAPNFLYGIYDNSGSAYISVISANFQAVTKVVNETNGSEVTMLPGGSSTWLSYDNALFAGLKAGDSCILQIYAS